MTEGPFARIKLTCEYCKYLRKREYTVMGFGTKGFYSFCDKTNKRVGENTFETPTWCPFLKDAVTKEIERATERLKELDKSYENNH